ncbi:MAG: phosphatase PAP2 family protein [Anaerolineales bacterium]
MSREHFLPGVILLLALNGSVFASGFAITSTSLIFDKGDQEENTKQVQRPKGQKSPSPFRDFHRDLKRNVLGLFSKEAVLPLLMGGGSAVGVAPVDDEVASYFLGPNDFPNIGRAGDVVLFAEVIAGGAGALLLARQSIQDEKLRRVAYSMTQALVLNNAITFALKPIANRARPNRASQFSFPSAHASNAFMTAVIADHYYGPAVGIPAYAVAAFISISRLQAKEHFMSDSIVGGMLGYLVGQTVVRQARDRKPPGRITWVPVISPARDKVGIRLQVRLRD